MLLPELGFNKIYHLSLQNDKQINYSMSDLVRGFALIGHANHPCNQLLYIKLCIFDDLDPVVMVVEGYEYEYLTHYKPN